VVQGTITQQAKKPRLPNSAIVNQTAVWEGTTYTFNPKTGKLSPRAKDDTKRGLPAVTIVKVEHKKVTFLYTSKDQPKPVVFTKNIKKRKKTSK
jgi:hypothetical protein